ncbi:MAG: hypothetical protein O3A00_11015 [Planctomycetota bacterium]|nr:hypothetical protein [Planctomycetota bacterium]
MTLKLTNEIRQALNASPGEPVTFEDEQSHEKYVLLPMGTYQRFYNIFRDDTFDVADTYAAQNAVAATSGWDDPEMDIYDDYDANRNPSGL